MSKEELIEKATSFANEKDSDVFIYTGDIALPYDSKVIELCTEASKRKNIAFFLCTNGGDPNVAYRIARCLQQNYERISVYIGGRCKSAGTLLSVGAHELIIGEHGQLGPLDIQLGKKDEIWETDSGLTILTAIETIEEKAFDLFESCFLKLKGRSGGRITLKTATELASKLAIGVVSPIMQQIDPMHVGEVNRAMKIGMEYGERLSKFSHNTKEGALSYLTNGYPSHEFVIDLEEAKDLFENVRGPHEEEKNLINLLGYGIREPNNDSPVFFYISEFKGGEEDDSSNQKNLGEGSETPRIGNGNAEEIGEDKSVIQFPKGN